MRGRSHPGVSIMRPVLAVAVLLAACLVTTVATAQNKIVREFAPLSASGITGQVSLDGMPNGETQLHSKLDGLQPNTAYVVVLFDQAGCATGTPSEIVEFT